MGEWRRRALRRPGLQPLADRSQSVIGRCDAQMTPERLRELGRLAVPDTARNLADGQVPVAQQRGGALHANPRQVLAKRGVADLGVRALELSARRGHAPGDVIKREVVRVFGLHDRDGVFEKRGPEVDG
jgi:hypothetical protein